MKRILIASVALVAVLFAHSCKSSPTVQPEGMTEPTAVLQLYPQGQNVDMGIVENGVNVTLGPGESSCLDTLEFYWDADGSLNNISDSARIEIYLPENRNGQMIVACPGGGYGELSYRGEGRYTAQALTTRGYSVAVVCYRLPNGHHTIPLRDVQNAFRYCRAHAAEWGITQIGVMGFSAGGHLAASASTLYVDEVTRPDFTALFYSVITGDPEFTNKGTFRRLTANDPVLIDHYSLEKRVTADTPPAIIFHSTNDKIVNPENSIRYYDALRSAGVRAEMYIFPKGGHGWGFTTMETAGRDPLDEYRPAFFDALYAFLDSLKPSE